MIHFYVNLHSCQGQGEGKVDLDHHVNKVVSKEPCHEADNDQQDGWDEHSQQVTYKWSTQGHFNNYGFEFIDD